MLVINQALTVCAILGRGQAGKTALAKRLTTPPDTVHKYSDEYVPTSGEEYVGNNIHVIELGGRCTKEARRRCAYYLAPKNIDCFIVCIAVDKPKSAKKVGKLLREVNEELSQRGVKKGNIILVTTKCDLIGLKHKDLGLKVLALAKQNKITSTLNVSAKTGENIKTLERMIRASSKKQTIIPEKTKKKKKGLFGKSKTHDVTEKSNQSSDSEAEDVGPIGGEKIVIRKEVGNELIYHCFHGDLKKVRKHIAECANINMKNQSYVSPIFASIMNRQILTLLELLKFPDLRCDDYNLAGETPLTYASIHGMYEIVEILMKCRMVLPDKKNKYCFVFFELIKDDRTKEAYFKVKEQEKLFLKHVGDQNAEEIDNTIRDVNVHCKNDSNESALEISLKFKDNWDIVEFLIEEGIKVDKNMYRIGQEYKDLLSEAYNQQTRRNIFIELVRTEKNYFEKLDLLNTFYLLPARKHIKKFIKKQELSTSVIKYFNLILEIKKKSFEFAEELIELFDGEEGKINEKKEKKIIKLLKDVDFELYLSFFQQKALLDKDIKEKECYKELNNFFESQRKSIKTKRARLGFFNYVVCIKDRIMQYQNFLLRLSQYCEQETKKSLEETTTHIIKSLREFDDKVKNEQNMRRMDIMFREKFKMETIAMNKKRKYVHHLFAVNTLLILSEEKSELKLMCFFLFSDLIAVVSKTELYFFFFHDIKSVFIFNNNNVQLTIYQAKSERKLFECIIILPHNKVMEFCGDMKDYYTKIYQSFYFPKLLMFFNFDKIHTTTRYFLEFKTGSETMDPIEIACQKREVFQRKREALAKELEDIEKENEWLIREVKDLRAKRENNENSLKLEAHEMMKKYQKKKNIISSPLVIAFKKKVKF